MQRELQTQARVPLSTSQLSACLAPEEHAGGVGKRPSKRTTGALPGTEMVAGTGILPTSQPENPKVLH